MNFKYVWHQEQQGAGLIHVNGHGALSNIAEQEIYEWYLKAFVKVSGADPDPGSGEFLTPGCWM